MQERLHPKKKGPHLVLMAAAVVLEAGSTSSEDGVAVPLTHQDKLREHLNQVGPTSS
jgi:hypothetical protein